MRIQSLPDHVHVGLVSARIANNGMHMHADACLRMASARVEGSHRGLPFMHVLDYS